MLPHPTPADQYIADTLAAFLGALAAAGHTVDTPAAGVVLLDGRRCAADAAETAALQWAAGQPLVPLARRLWRTARPRRRPLV